MKIQNIMIICIAILILYLLIHRKLGKFVEYMTNDTSVYNVPWANKVTQTNITGINEDSDTIFVLIASYRDDQCPITIKELYSKAKNPRRIFVGIHQQNADADIDCLNDSVNTPCVIKENIRISRVKDIDAKGPVVARYHASLLYKDETYLLIIDSHMRCLQDWDMELINMYKECRAKKGNKIILSQYPMEFNVDTNNFPDNYNDSTTIFCDAMFNNDGIIQPKSMVVKNWDYKNTDKWLESPFVAGGMMFSNASVLKDVPFDSTLTNLFHGEELLYSMRLYTTGYRIYTFPKNMIFHFYERKNYPKVWDNKSFYDDNKKTLMAVKRILLLENDEEKKNNHVKNIDYPVKAIDVQNYYNVFNIDVKNKKLTDWCKNYKM